MTRRVVVTGVGVITALGAGAGGDLAGPARRAQRDRADPQLRRRRRCGPGWVRSSPTSTRRTTWTGGPSATMTRNEQLAVGGATLAVRDAGLERRADGERTALFTGSSKEVSDLDQAGRRDRRPAPTRRAVRRPAGRASGPRSFHPLFYVEGLQGASLFYISSAFQLLGANTYFAGHRRIRDDRDRPGVPGRSAAARPTARSRAASTTRSAGGRCRRSTRSASSPAATSWATAAFRPYDRDASGTVLGEGAAFVVLEEYETARERGAHVYAEITGFGGGADADRLLTPHPRAAAWSPRCRRALQEARVRAGDVGYVAAHGSATRSGRRQRGARRCAPSFGARDRACRQQRQARDRAPGRRRGRAQRRGRRAGHARRRHPADAQPRAAAAGLRVSTGSRAPPVELPVHHAWPWPAASRGRTPCSPCERCEEGV